MKTTKSAIFTIRFSLSVDDWTNYSAFIASDSASVSCNKVLLICFYNAFKETDVLVKVTRKEFKKSIELKVFSNWIISFNL